MGGGAEKGGRGRDKLGKREGTEVVVLSVSRIVEDTVKGSKGWKRCNCKEVQGSCTKRLGQPGHNVAVRRGSSKGERAEESRETSDEVPGENR